MKCSVFIAASVDGFIAKLDDDISWLFDPAYVLDDTNEDYGFKAFLASVDVIVMGRRTFEKVLTLGEWAYGTIPIVVLTHRELNVPDSLRGTVSSMSATPTELVGTLAARGHLHAYIDGGVTIRDFLRSGLMHELTVTSIPILLGKGLHLFADNGVAHRLTLVTSHSFSNGFVKNVYKVNAASESTL